MMEPPSLVDATMANTRLERAKTKSLHLGWNEVGGMAGVHESDLGGHDTHENHDRIMAVCKIYNEGTTTPFS